MTKSFLTQPLLERYRLNPASVTTHELLEALERLALIEKALDQADLSDDPESDTEYVGHIEKVVERAVDSAKEAFADHAEYVQFFEDCFESLSKHYPCPSVTVAYDCQVIFDAIRKGDESSED